MINILGSVRSQINVKMSINVNALAKLLLSSTMHTSKNIKGFLPKGKILLQVLVIMTISKGINENKEKLGSEKPNKNINYTRDMCS